MIGSEKAFVFLASMPFAVSWQWVVEIFNDQQRMVQIGAVVAVAAIFLLSRSKQ